MNNLDLSQGPARDALAWHSQQPSCALELQALELLSLTRMNEWSYHDATTKEMSLLIYLNFILLVKKQFILRTTWLNTITYNN